MTEKLQINMLGEFSLTYGANKINDQDNRSKKVWLLLAYMICNRDREISHQELIDLLWANESSDNPANALKTMFHRLRAFLDKLNYVGGRQMIISRHGAYVWNDQLELSIDTEQFEQLARQARRSDLDEEQRLELYRQLTQFYKGDFLPKYSMEPWVIPLSVYYHMMYLQAVHELLALLSARRLYQEMVALCSQAVEIDPYDEELYYHLIKALVDSGQQQAAIRQYEQMTELFYHKFGVTPNEELTALYREVVRTTNSMETDLNIIKEQLREADQIDGAFFCEYEFFKDIYRIEARSAARSGSAIHIGLITAMAENGGKLPQRHLNSSMDKLQECVRLSLRRGDVYARYSVSQYIIMLPQASFEDSRAVLERILRRFNRENPRSPARLSSALQPLEPVMF